MKKLIASLKTDERRRMDLIFLCGFAVILALLIWKAPYGYGVTADESFYLSIPNRILQGDSFISDEWNLSQTSSFLLLPLVWLYKTLFHSLDGIQLFCRYVYIFGHALSALFIYWRLRRFGWGGMAAALLHFAFVPYGIDAYSYNTMAVDSLAAGGALCATLDGKKPLRFLWAGLLFAIAVLSCPFLVAVYPVYALLALLGRLPKKKPRLLQEPLFSGKCFWSFTLGCGILAAVYVGFLALTVDIPLALKSLPAMTQVADHDSYTVLDAIFTYIITLGTSKPHMNYLYTFSCIAFLGEMLMLLFDKNRRKRRAVYLAGGCVCALMALLVYGSQPELYYQAVMLPLAFAGLPAYVLLKDKPRTLFVSLFLMGVFYSFADFLSSNNYYFVVAMGFSVSNLASVLFISLLLKEMKEEPDEEDQDADLLRRGAGVLAAVTIGLLGLLRVQIIRSVCFHDVMPSACTETLSVGPAKGIRTQADYAEFYQAKYDELMYLRENYPAGVLCDLSDDSWPYMVLDEFTCGSYSPWFPDDDLGKLNEWWQLHPDRIPDYILVPVWEGTLNESLGMCSASIASQDTVDALIAAGYREEYTGKAYRILVRQKAETTESTEKEESK